MTSSSPEDFHSSIGVSSIPGALSLGSALSAVCTSSRVMSGSLSCSCFDHSRDQAPLSYLSDKNSFLCQLEDGKKNKDKKSVNKLGR